MRELNKKLILPEGHFTGEVIEFEPGDCCNLVKIYDSWRNLCGLLNEVGARSVNLPEGLSETAFCIAKDVWRITKNINRANSSFDCYDPKGGLWRNRIQVKACSVLPDLTSFGPKSQWDRIFFVDFYRKGKWNGKFDIYEIDTDDINNFLVNGEETVLDQKLQGRRPRFSIYEGLIKCDRYISKETYKITKNGVEQVP